MRSFANSAEPPVATEAGLGAPVRHEEDPYRVLDDLMVAVELLCPGWPPRAAFVEGGKKLH